MAATTTAVAAATAAAAAAAAAAEGMHPVDEAIQSLLGLAEAGPSADNLAAAGPWAHWEAAGSHRGDAMLRRRLTHHNVQQGRLRFPGAVGGETWSDHSWQQA